ncbi:TolC family protein [Sphingomonas sp. dw_22]|uniref:efflux transporter outer membrane subunit n=1 Tax=Sphingomonas sp. dw_22 TaxID=2721175 RepID=UPI001BD52E62|nr:TolC family protein [Sphingomonas sp. dw_22]
MRTALISLTALLLASCATGPSYVAPSPPVASAGPLIGSASPAVSTAEAVTDWWKLYEDPILDGLVADALAANTDIRVAVARLERAQAAFRAARADRLPQGSIDATGGYQRAPEMQALPGADRETGFVDGGLSVSYEVDLFGRVRRGIEAARGDAAAAQADADAVRVAIVADTTRAYVDAASAAHRLAVAKRSVALLDQSLRLTGKRVEAGRATKLDTLRIGSLRDQQAAEIPAIEAERQAALFRLATLTGRAPAELPASAGARETLPLIDRPIPVGDGAALLQRRPDVRAAERRLAADTARIGVATADLYPHIALGGSVGQTSTGFGDLLTGGPLRFLLGPLISWNANPSAARAKIAEARADTHASLAQFDGAVLRALEETETALSAYAKALDRRHRLVASRDQANDAARIVRARQREGQVDFLVVIDAERTAADAEARVALADARVADAQIDLFKALGGGWQSASRAQVAAK